MIITEPNNWVRGRDCGVDGVTNDWFATLMILEQSSGIQKSDEWWCAHEDVNGMPEKAFRELPQPRVDIPLQDITQTPHVVP